MTRKIILLAAECCAVAALLWVIDSGLAEPRHAAMATSLLVYPAAFLMSLATLGFRWSPAVRGFFCLGLLLAVLWIQAFWLYPVDAGAHGSMHDVLNATDYKRCAIAMLAATILCIRGWRLASREPNGDAMASSFQLGLVVLGIAGIFGATNVADEPALMALSLIYVVLALLGLWHPRTSRQQRQGRAPRFDLALLAVCMVLALAFATITVVDKKIVGSIAAVPAWIGGQISTSLRSLSGFIPAPQSEAERDRAPSRPATEQTPPDWIPALFELIRRHDQALGVLVCAAIAAYLLSWILRWRSSVSAHALRIPGIAYRRVATSLMEAIRHWWRHWCDQCVRRLARMKSAVQRLVSRFAERNSVRDLYHGILRRLALKGWTRSPDETPEAFQRRLMPLWPGDAGALAALTAAFVADCYGPRRLSTTDLGPTVKQVRLDLRKLGRRNG